MKPYPELQNATVCVIVVIEKTQGTYGSNIAARTIASHGDSIGMFDWVQLIISEGLALIVS